MITPEAQQKGLAARQAATAERDNEILALLAQGASYAEVAAALGIRVDGARTAILRARRRAGIRIRAY